MRARLAILLAGSVALGGCAYGFGDYGSYGGLSVGIGSSYGGYGGYPYGGYGYGSYGMPYYGWYDNYYYPGSGVYVYDSYRRPHIWSDRQQRYWTDRRNRVERQDRNRLERHDRDRNGDRTQATTRTQVRENWSGFDRRDNATRSDRRSTRPQRSDSDRPR